MQKLLNWHTTSKEAYERAKEFYRDEYSSMIEKLKESTPTPFCELELVSGKGCVEVEEEDFIRFLEGLISEINSSEFKGGQSC